MIHRRLCALRMSSAALEAEPLTAVADAGRCRAMACSPGVSNARGLPGWNSRARRSAVAGEASAMARTDVGSTPFPNSLPGLRASCPLGEVRRAARRGGVASEGDEASFGGGPASSGCTHKGAG